MEHFDAQSECVRALEREGRKPKRSGDLYSFRCVRHDDREASAWVGQYKWGCQACVFEEGIDSLCGELGIAVPKPGFTVEDYADKKAFSLDNLTRWGVVTGTGKFGDPVVEIPFYAADGITKLRGKQRSANKTWWGEGKGVHLYGLWILAKAKPAEPVILCEGESDSHACWTHRVLAIGVPGANAWRREWASFLAGRQVFIWQEPGEAGAKFVQSVAASCPGALVLSSSDYKDLADLHKASSTEFRTRLEALKANAKPWTAPAVASGTSSPMPAASLDGEVKPGATPIPAGPALAVREASTITPKRIEWRWRLRLSRGRYHEIVGFPGIGKTALVMDMIGRLTTGDGWPDGDRCEATDVLIVAAEDEAEDVLVPRLIAAGADLKRVHFVDGIRRGAHIEELDLSQAFDFDAVRKLVIEKKVGLIYVDALDDVLGANHDGKGNAETRRALAPIRQLAKQTGATVLALRHPTKKVALGPALNNGNGSIAYGAVCRGSMLVVCDAKEPEIRLLLATKSNIGRLAPTLRFKLVGERDDDPPKISWEGTDNRMAEDVLAEIRMKEQENPADAQEELTKVEEAMELLREWLKDRWLPVPEINRLASQQDVAPKTLQRAKQKLGLKYEREGFGKGSRVVCGFPEVPYQPTPADVGKHGEGKTAPESQVPTAASDTGEQHTRPLHTRPSEVLELGASMGIEQGDAWEPETAA